MCIFDWPRIKEIMIFYRFFSGFFLNSDISVTVHVMRLEFSECDLKVLLEGSVSQNLYLGLSFYFITKNGKLFFNIIFYI